MKPYDNTSATSIETYAKRLIGHTFKEAEMLGVNGESDDDKAYKNDARKGGLGNLIEERYFGYKANSDSSADFDKAGLELKVTPFEKNKNGTLRAGERLVLTMISYEKAVEEVFEMSHLWEKCSRMLMIFYLRDRDIDKMQWRIKFVEIFTPPKQDMPIIIQDYNYIIAKIKAGKADELSESDTNYLGACTKGSTAEKSIVPQKYYAPEKTAKKRAYCFKQSYMTYVLNNYIVKNGKKDEAIIIDADEIRNKSFDEIIVEKIEKYVGKTDKNLCALFNREYNNNKSQWIELAYRMLGIKSNKAEEFEKAHIVVKAIRLEENGKMVESSPLPQVRFLDLVKEEWEDSELYNYLSDTRFLFVVYRKCADNYVLKGAQLWNMPYKDLDNTVREGWLKIRDTIKDGVVFDKVLHGDVVRISNNLPKKRDNRILHMRPHTSKSYYVMEDGTSYGSGSVADTDLLPDGRRMTKQSFWLNNTYIMSQLRDDLKS